MIISYIRKNYNTKCERKGNASTNINNNNNKKKKSDRSPTLCTN